MDLITEKDPEIRNLFGSMDKLLEIIETHLKNCRPVLNGEIYITDRQLSERLHVSRRTLQEYRTKGVLPYIQLAGKVLYKESDVQQLLDKGYLKAFRE